MTDGRPLISTTRDAIVEVIKIGDTTAKVHPSLTNVKETPRFKELFFVANQVHAWFVDYPPDQPSDSREDPAGDLYFRKHAFVAHLFYGPYDDRGQTDIAAADILQEVYEALIGDVTIFGDLVPEITERTVVAPTIDKEKIHGILMHHGQLRLEVTVSTFRPT